MVATFDVCATIKEFKYFLFPLFALWQSSQSLHSTLRLGSGCSTQSMPLLFYQVNPRSFKCLFFLILRVWSQRKYRPMVFQVPGVVYFILKRKHWDVRGERGKLKQQTPPWLTCLKCPSTGTIKGSHLHHQRCFSVTFALFWKTQSPWIMPYVIPQVSLVPSTGNVSPFAVSFLFLTQNCHYLHVLTDTPVYSSLA